MMSLGLITDIVLVALLVVTLFYVLRLLRRLGELHKDRESFQKLILDFSAATAQADRSLADLRIGADGLGKELSDRIGHGQSVVSELQRSSEDLKMLIARAENAADKLEGHLGAMRPATSPATPTSSDTRARAATEPRPAQDAQTQALLSALGRIR